MSENDLYKLYLEDRGKYLYALASGETLTPEIAKLYWDEIAEECRKLGKRKVLIEKDFAQSVSAPEMITMSFQLGALLAGSSIAFMDRHENEDVNELGKKMARNQGIKMQIFMNISDAEKWLLVN